MCFLLPSFRHCAVSLVLYYPPSYKKGNTHRHIVPFGVTSLLTKKYILLPKTPTPYSQPPGHLQRSQWSFDTHRRAALEGKSVLIL